MRGGKAKCISGRQEGSSGHEGAAKLPALRILSSLIYVACPSPEAPVKSDSAITSFDKLDVRAFFEMTEYGELHAGRLHYYSDAMIVFLMVVRRDLTFQEKLVMTAQYAFESVIQHLISPLQSLNRSGGYEALAWYRRVFRARLAADGITVDAVERKFGPWTEEENKELVRLYYQHGGDFDAIAKELGDPSSKCWRSPGQCRRQWNDCLDPSIKRGEWDEEEDEKLKALVSKYGVGKWAKIASEMNGRTASMCRQHWNDTLDPAIKRGEWGKDEDEKLKALVSKYGVGKWAKIAGEMNGRTSTQCSKRWNLVGPSKLRRPSKTRRPSVTARNDCLDDSSLIKLPSGTAAATAAMKLPREHIRSSSATHLTCSIDALKNENGQVGVYLPEDRKARIEKFNRGRIQRHAEQLRLQNATYEIVKETVIQAVAEGASLIAARDRSYSGLREANVEYDPTAVSCLVERLMA